MRASYFLELLSNPSLKGLELGKLRLEIGPLPQQARLVRLEHREEALELRPLVAPRLVHVDQFPNLGKRKAEALAAQRELQPGAVARRIDAPLTVAARCEQALILVEADRARRDVELARQVADRELGRLRFHGRVSPDSIPMVSLEYPWPETPPPGETIAVAPGIHWLSMPLPFQLDHINLWLLEDEGGWTVVDT